MRLRSFSCLALVLCAPTASAAVERDPTDRNLVKALEEAHPEAAQLLERGEALLRAGDAAQAADIFRRLDELSRPGGFAARRHCQALTQLGRKREAIDACRISLLERVLPTTLRASAAAHVLVPPTPNELNLAVRYAEEAKRRMPDQPWGYAAECDIADRLGDKKMLQTCTDELRRIAPGHYETERHSAAAATSALATPWWVSAAWVALFIACAGTLVHAFWRGVRRLRAAPVAFAVVFGLSASAQADEKPHTSAEPSAPAESAAKELGAPPAKREVPAGGMSKWKINEEDPSASIPPMAERNKDPIQFAYFLMDLADRAQVAEKKGDFKKAALHWEAAAKGVPDAAVSYRKACAAWEKAGDLERAILVCSAVLGVKGVQVQDHARYANVLLGRAQSLTKQQTEDLSEMITHLQADPAGATLANELTCKLGLKLDDETRLQDCTDRLAKAESDDRMAIPYQWALAIRRGNFAEAEQLIERAKHAGVGEEALLKMQQRTAEEQSLSRRIRRNWRPLAGAGAFVVLGGAFWFGGRRVARAKKRDKAGDPRATGADTGPAAGAEGTAVSIDSGAEPTGAGTSAT